MNKTVCWSIVLLGWAVLARAEKVNVVQITDMRGQSAYEVMDKDEFAALTQAIKEETAVFSASVAACKKEWDADKENKSAFPGTRIKVRVAKKLPMDYADREKAGKKRDQLQERMNDKQLEEMDKLSKKRKMMKDEDVAKEESRIQAFETALKMVSTKMGEKLKRPVPEIGFASSEPVREAPKKDEKKASKKREEKK